MTEKDIQQLDDYLGSTPMPTDFDYFWTERMAEADRVELEYQITQSEIPSFSTCSYLDLWFTGMDGSKVYAKYLKPRSDKSVPLVLQFHGYPGSSRSWLEQSSYAGMGMAIIALDCPGQGGRGYDPGGYPGTTVSGHLIAGLDGPPEKLYYVRMHQNIRILCRIVRQLEGIDLSRVFVNGASQGGALGLACTALNPELINRAAILYPFLSDYRMIWELGADEIAYEGLRYYSRWFDPEEGQNGDWFAKLGYVDSMNFAHLIRCPILFGTGLADTICPPQTQCAVYNQLNCPKKRYLFSGMGHEEIQEFDDLILNFFTKEVPEL